MNRFPIAFAQTVAFAAATGSITWQILRALVQRGTEIPPLVIALAIAAGFGAGALLFALVIAPLRDRFAVRAMPGGHQTRLRLLHILIAMVWVVAWAAPGFQFVTRGGADAFWGFVCFSMAGLSGALFYAPQGSNRTPV